MNSTESQRRAIESDAKEILVVAGPGSGKTATTVERIAQLVAAGVDPAGIIALTFTNAAARELEIRLSLPLVGVGHAGRIGHCGTLHGFALRMLKQHGENIGYGSRMSIIGEDAAADLLASKAKMLGCHTPIKQLMKAKTTIHHRVGRMTATEVRYRMSDDERVIRAYYSDLRDAGMVDFDTILSEFERMLSLDVVAAVCMTKFTHLFVDEVQDSAEIDWMIYERLPIPNKFYVGDADQSIYAFRGGRPDLMRKKAEKPGVAVVLLQDNFRSHAEICWAAQRLIEHNRDRIPKATLSTKGDGGSIVVFRPALNPGEECAQIVAAVREASEKVDREVPLEETSESFPVPTADQFAEIAVLARTNDICFEIRKQLKASGFPVAADGKVDVPADWTLAKAVVELLVNPDNDTLAYFYAIAKQRKSGAPEARARLYADDVQRNARSHMISINRQIGLFLGGPYTLADVGLLLAQEGISNESRMRTVSVMRRLDANADLLTLALAMGQDQGDPPKAVVGVTVTTLHGSKGREFDTVILAGFEDEILPSARGDIEESRRLAYVGVTRARKHLYITHSTTRKTSWGSMEAHRISRFVKEMGL